MYRRIGTVLLLVILTVPTGVLAAQESTLRRGFRDLRLGLTYEAAQDVLRSDNAFSYRGEPDLSISLTSSEDIIDTGGNGFVDRAVLQFAEDRLISIALHLDRRELDYFQLFKQLETRYGPASDINPHWAMWEDDDTRIRLERPLTVSFMDTGALEAERSRESVESSISAETRERFLAEF